jgi:hypothetical protein
MTLTPKKTKGLDMKNFKKFFQKNFFIFYICIANKKVSISVTLVTAINDYLAL